MPHVFSPFPLGKTKIRQPIMPTDFVSSAIKPGWPYTQMHPSAIHSNIPESVFLNFDYQEAD